MLGVTGLILTTDGDENYDAHARILVSNHTLFLDHIITDILIPHFMPISRPVTPFFEWLLSLKMLPREKSKEEIKTLVKSFCDESTFPLLFYPEQATTNGKVGLLKFNVLPFDIGHLIQPVGITVSRPTVFNINITVIQSSWMCDLLWCLFAPYTVYTLRFLPVTEKKENESTVEFSERVRFNLSKSLNLKLTDFTRSDKTDYLKRKQLLPPSQNAQSAEKKADKKPQSEVRVEEQPMDPNLQRMIEQVQAVLPHVPAAAIKKDIEVTCDVDVTITNILEGRVPFAEEKKSSPNIGDGHHIANDISQVTFKAESFSKNVKERHLSLEERKALMLESARLKYKQKHNLL
ncbi:lipid droplet-regulating VLDL assembly factor AUP1-like isoform X2 [Gigantopelta aegis]|nr:lipid droplet-regulating VLDL assembly factor AUP1-like isoform X2 [Gigantopelta aegis]XP_041371186.1 lipid droplet-regulating VLDL assembly factor AUP1-like isoform X2 [Gigantopelta aegis]